MSTPSGAPDAPTRRLPRTPPRRRSWPQPGLLVAAVVLAVPAAVVVFADRLGIDHRTPFVQLIAFRWQLAAALVALGALAALVRGLRPVGIALGLVGVVGLLLVAPRALPAGGAPEQAAGGDLTVLSLNTYLGRADAEAIADLVADSRPDVVVLPEARSELRARVTRALADERGGRRYQTASADRSADTSPMTIFVARDLGRANVRADRETEFPSLVVDLPGRLRVVATHPQSPKPGDTNAWRRDVAALARWCTDVERPTIVAGDLNATLDHAELRTATAGCTDAAAQVGEGLHGTWPAQLPGVFGTQIDHVMLAGGPQARSVEFPEVAGTDHRAVLARVTRG